MDVKVENVQVEIVSVIKKEQLEDNISDHATHNGVGSKVELEYNGTKIDIKIEPDDDLAELPERSCDSDITSANTKDIFKVDCEEVEMRSVIKKEQLENNVCDHSTHAGGSKDKLMYGDTKIDIKIEPICDLADVHKESCDGGFCFVEVDTRPEALLKSKREETQALGGTSKQYTKTTNDAVTTGTKRSNDDEKLTNSLSKCVTEGRKTNVANNCTKLAKDMDSKTDSRSSIYLCDYCNCKFRSKLFLTRHLDKHKMIHQSKSTFTLESKCNLEKRLKSEKIKLSEVDKFQKFTQISPAIKSNNTNLSESTPEGDKPREMSVNISSHLTSPIRTHTGDKLYSCSYCSRTFTISGHLTTHMRTHTGEKPYSCSQCSKSFTRVDSLTTHMRTHTGEKPYSCSHCSKTFTRSPGLNIHMKTHTGEKPYSCSHCSKGFSDSSSLNTHIRTHTGEKPYSCSQCGKSFTHSSSFNLHLRTHTGERPYKCSHCSKCFTRINSLNIHIRSHTGEKPFSCSHCSKRFSDSSSLNTHIRTHTGEKPYSCNQCGKSFTHSTSLKTHIRTHTGEKPYSCSYCSKRFTRTTSLNIHIRSHTGEKPYSCSHCSKSFTDSSSLNAHKRTHLLNV